MDALLEGFRGLGCVERWPLYGPVGCCCGGPEKTLSLGGDEFSALAALFVYDCSSSFGFI